MKKFVGFLLILLIISIALNAYFIMGQPDIPVISPIIKAISNPSGFADVRPEKIISLELCLDYEPFTKMSSDRYTFYNTDAQSLINNGYPEYYSYLHGSVHCAFSSDKVLDMISLISKGNPKEFKVASDNEGRWGHEKVDRIIHVMYLNNNDELEDKLFTCSNMDAIENYFKDLDILAIQP